MPLPPSLERLQPAGPMPPSSTENHDEARGILQPGLDFELLFRHAPSLLLVLEAEPQFRILAASDAYLRATRSRREAVVGRAYFEAFPEKEEGERVTGATGLRTALERVLATRAPDALNWPVAGADGRLRYIIHRVDAMELEVLRSSRERDEAMRQLRIANEELEAFITSASHDLRVPINAIDGFCRLFLEIHGEAVDEPTRRLLGRIDSNLSRMDGIIDGLLLLSRVGRAQLVRKRVDLTALARAILGELAARDPQRRVAVEVSEGLEATADERLVQGALENLLGNAWKYTVRREAARIEVGRRRVVGQDVFYVRDNGAGFDMAHAERLFTPFTRLHSASEFEGHGIGLAAVKRIVERHGGEIWAQASPGEGATFHFTLRGSVL